MEVVVSFPLKTHLPTRKSNVSSARKLFALLRSKLPSRVLLNILLVSNNALLAQSSPQQTMRKSQDVPSSRPAGISELARDNYNRVAASALQIKDVLTKDPGIMVEVKHLIAKEASDNGQFVNDEDLTDQAVNDRLTNDLGFRAAVTRLVQRYGYLLPQFNPDSDAGKQQEFVLKERARRQVQIESQEDSNALQPHSNTTSSQTDDICDSANYDTCGARSANQARQNLPVLEDIDPHEGTPQEIPRQAQAAL